MENVRKCQIDIFRVLCGVAGRAEGYLKLFSRDYDMRVGISD
jgi:hypothetical protein